MIVVLMSSSTVSARWTADEIARTAPRLAK